MPMEFTVRFWGVRGTLASGGNQFAEVGGNTSCVEVRAGNELMILDAGTGVFRLGESLPTPVHATILFSHFHWDHIQGWPLFRPAYVAENSFVLCGPRSGGGGPLEALSGQMRPPYFPVSLESLSARLDFRVVSAGEAMRIGAATVRTAALNHPQGCLGYRISMGRASVVYATDTEPPERGSVDARVVELARRATVLIYDAQYTDDEYDGRSGPARKGWGHSTITDACRLALAAEVQQLVLFHHDPSHSDRVIERLAGQARLLFPRAISAHEGMMLHVGEARCHSHGNPGPVSTPARVQRA